MLRSYLVGLPQVIRTPELSAVIQPGPLEEKGLCATDRAAPTCFPQLIVSINIRQLYRTSRNLVCRGSPRGSSSEAGPSPSSSSPLHLPLSLSLCLPLCVCLYVFLCVFFNDQHPNGRRTSNPSDGVSMRGFGPSSLQFLPGEQADRHRGSDFHGLCCRHLKGEQSGASDSSFSSQLVLVYPKRQARTGRGPCLLLFNVRMLHVRPVVRAPPIRSDSAHTPPSLCVEEGLSGCLVNALRSTASISTII